jgi:hypothetical protein
LDSLNRTLTPGHVVIHHIAVIRLRASDATPSNNAVERGFPNGTKEVWFLHKNGNEFFSDSIRLILPLKKAKKADTFLT